MAFRLVPDFSRRRNDSIMILTGIGLIIATIGHRFFIRIDRQFNLLRNVSDSTLRSDLSKWVITLILLAYVLIIEEQSLRSIGATQPDPFPVLGGFGGLAEVGLWWGLGVVGTVSLTYIILAVYRIAELTVPSEFGADQATRGPIRYGITAVTAGVTESLLFQAYPIERLTLLTGSVVIATVTSWIVFTAVHYLGDTFSLEETIYIGAPAAAVTGLYVLSSSIYVIVLVHTTVVLLSFVSE